MHAPRLRGNMRGAIDVPFKLLVSVVVMAMAAAILLPVVHSYQLSELERRIDVAVTGISSAARSVHHHPGSSRTVHLNVPPAGSFHLERLVIGGDLTGPPSETASITWRHSGGGNGRTLVSTSTGHVPLADDEGVGLNVEGPSALLVLESVAAPRGCWSESYVQVRVSQGSCA